MHPSSSPIAASAILVLIAAGVSGCGAAPGPAARDQQAEAEIRTQSQLFVQAWQREDPAAIAAMFTADGRVLVPGTPDVAGSDSVLSWVTAVLDAATIESLEVTPREVLVSGDLAVETGHYDERYTLTGGDPIEEHGRYITVWRRSAEGAWRIHQFATNLRVSAE